MPNEFNEIAARIKYDPKIGYGYDPVSGRLWRIKEVGTTSETRDGRRRARWSSIHGCFSKQVTHIMWRLMTGEWPPPGVYIDYKDANVGNMAWSNLRCDKSKSPI